MFNWFKRKGQKSTNAPDTYKNENVREKENDDYSEEENEDNSFYPKGDIVIRDVSMWMGEEVPYSNGDLIIKGSEITMVTKVRPRSISTTYLGEKQDINPSIGLDSGVKLFVHIDSNDNSLNPVYMTRDEYILVKEYYDDYNDKLFNKLSNDMRDF